MYHLDPQEEWNSIHPEDLWVYNKLILSRKLGYTCGPVGCDVPCSDFYIIRPSMNLLGMGRFSRIQYIEKSTDSFHPSEFWCEVLIGEHLSVDFQRKTPSLIVRGEREPESPLYKWKRWEKVYREVIFPDILNDLKGDYEWINCEFIGNQLIEVHFRRNPDFRYNNSIAIPIWNEEDIQNPRYKYIRDEDYLRKGFLID